jgi:hypothetical protein
LSILSAPGIVCRRRHDLPAQFLVISRILQLVSTVRTNPTKYRRFLMTVKAAGRLFMVSPYPGSISTVRRNHARTFTVRINSTKYRRFLMTVEAAGRLFMVPSYPSSISTVRRNPSPTVTVCANHRPGRRFLKTVKVFSWFPHTLARSRRFARTLLQRSRCVPTIGQGDGF